MAEHTNGTDSGQKSTGQLLKDLSGELTTLIQQEMQLARVEMSAKAKVAGAGAGALGTAAVFGLLGAGALVAAGIAGLANVVQVWLAALIVGGALVVVAGIAALIGRGMVAAAAPPVPEEAITTTKEDVEWLRAQTRSAKR